MLKNVINCILSQPILSHPILSYPIPTYPILSYHIPSYPIPSSYSIISLSPSYHTCPNSPIALHSRLSFPIPFFHPLTISYHISIHPILFYPDVSYPVMYPILSCFILSCLMMFYWHFCYRTLQMYFEGLFPRDNPRNTRFAINFFTAIGLGGLTYVQSLQNLNMVH